MSPRTLFLVALASLAPTAAVPAQSAPEPPVPFTYAELMTRDVSAFNSAAASKATRVRLFDMPSGFLVNPLGIEEEEPPPGTPPETAKGGGDDDPLSYLQVNLGMYNPNFDLHLPGDPGKLGYYKLYSQLQLVDQASTSVCLGLQAYTPAGIQFNGVNNGPTTVSPTLSWFQELGAGTALQGYVGQSIRANSRWQDNLNANFQYGMGLQYPLPITRPQSKQNVYIFVQALGRYRYDGVSVDGHQAYWEVLPGVHWRWSDSCWMSVGVSHNNFLTCSWQF
jgi:hypothetical protein